MTNIEINSEKNLLRHNAYRHPRVLSVLKTFAVSAGYFVAALSLIDLLGLGLALLKMEMPNDALLAITFFSLACALIFSVNTFSISPVLQQRIVRFFLGATLFFTVLRFAGAFLNSIPKLEQIFFGENFRGNRISTISVALNFMALCLAYYYIDLEYKNKIRPSQLLSLFVIFSSLFVVLGFVYDVRFGQNTQVSFKALLAMFFFILLSVANLALRPEEGFVALGVTKSTGGTLTRRLIPACFFVPPCLGAIGLLGERWGLYNREFALVIVVILHVLIFSVLIWQLAHILFQLDIKRGQAEEAVRLSSLTDELTGLYNRRGFTVLAEQQIKIAKRKQACVLFFADMDGLKKINDQFGHKEGDKALTRLARLLKNSFRESDIVARYSGDEFAMLCILEHPKQMSILTTRLANETAICQLENPGRPYQLSLSFGISFLAGKEATLEKLLVEADKKLYEAKELKKKSQPPQ